MRHRLHPGIGAALVLGLCLGATGCAEAPAGARRPQHRSRSRSVTPWSGTSPTTRTSPPASPRCDSVEVRAHVWGYLDKVNFKEGALVKKGDVLFELDPRPYQADLDQAKAKVGPG